MTEDPHARFRALPDPVPPEDAVETADASGPPAREGEAAEAWRTTVVGPGG